MNGVFRRYNIPIEIQRCIYKFMQMRDEFNLVLYTIDIGSHSRQFYLEKDERGYDIIAKAQDIYRPRYWAFSPDPSKAKFRNNIYLSEKYTYVCDAWPDYNSLSSPNIVCKNCDLRARYKDKSRNKHLPVCNCLIPVCN